MGLFYLSFKIKTHQVSGIREDRDGSLWPLVAPGALLFLGEVHYGRNKR